MMFQGTGHGILICVRESSGGSDNLILRRTCNIDVAHILRGIFIVNYRGEPLALS